MRLAADDDDDDDDDDDVRLHTFSFGDSLETVVD